MHSSVYLSNVNSSWLPCSLFLCMCVRACVHVNGTSSPGRRALGAIVAVMEPTQTSSSSCQEDGEVSEWVALPCLFIVMHEEQCGSLPGLCLLPTRVGSKGLLCVLIDL